MYPGNVIMWLSLGVVAGVAVSLATNTISTRREALRKAMERLDNRTTMLEHQVELLVKAAVGHRP